MTAVTAPSFPCGCRAVSVLGAAPGSAAASGWEGLAAAGMAGEELPTAGLGRSRFLGLMATTAAGRSPAAARYLPCYTRFGARRQMRIAQDGQMACLDWLESSP